MALLKEIGHFVTTNTFSGLYYSSIYPWTVGQLKGQDYGDSRNEPEEECLHGTNADCTVHFILSDRSCFFIKKTVSRSKHRSLNHGGQNESNGLFFQ